MEGELCLPKALDAMRRVLLRRCWRRCVVCCAIYWRPWRVGFVLDAMEVWDVPDVPDVLEIMRCVLSVCWRLWTVGSVCWTCLEVLEVPEVMRCVLLSTLWRERSVSGFRNFPRHA